MKRKLLIAMGLAASMASTTAMASAVDASIPEYQKVSGISGNFSSVGSDTLANLMTLWAEEFKRMYPNVNIQIQAAGSSTAPPALTQSTSNVGPMSRMMKAKEEAMFEKEHGYKPTPIGVAIDALAVYVHKDNPIKGLSIPQVDAIFSSTRKCGLKDDITTWGEAGVKGELADKSIQLYGRNSVSGTYGYYKKMALCKGDYKSSVNEQPGSASVVQSTATSLNGIGYSGIGYKTAGVRALPLSKKEGGKLVEPTPNNALNGTYPLARVLYVYVNKKPNAKLDPLTREFMNLVLSQQGQQTVVKDGYIPLPANMVEKYRAKLNN
ncbi:MAG: phosphate ABC transporter substrate-binding protein PstS family protein [Hydrogenovibrio sp.]|uniref:PstS family phosphate ABC transporter substrate-binding protein n=1 Tax=Hydrogenovibrio sp. TaxID=2065821 RepID=UPI00286FE1AC|nr:phosphate ABC transporter substrate-binding protein PstS family protein [Hydrogenovibrio sp.]MDR9499063.1 phosphate ABC transporter substrate-binding protein PstS family protein [Hydrogenovibrio sp.]